MNSDHAPKNDMEISAIRDTIMESMTIQFKKLLKEDRHDDAMALADEFFEWLHPVLMQREETLYSDETELRRAYIELTSR
mgnify:CR=1 FL=1|jgi:hypothetical protein|tara:strand:- start:38 stop:277 length:240 start_codon:yes stop_codon:yes gene_type:complete